MRVYISDSPEQTENIGERLGKFIGEGTVAALFGSLGMGKTAFVRGMARGLGLDAEVSSPTFALVHEYGGNPPFYHFDMYRVDSWEDLYSTGFFDYIDSGAILAVEWSENIENALPEKTIRVEFARGETDTQRIIRIESEKAEGFDEDTCD